MPQTHTVTIYLRVVEVTKALSVKSQSIMQIGDLLKAPHKE